MTLPDPQPRRRLALLSGLLVLSFVGLGVWLAHVQIVQHERLARLAAENVQRKSLRPARRGAIVDRRGGVLATSVPTKTVCADPSFIYAHHDLVARTLAPILQLPEADVFKRLMPRTTLTPEGTLKTNKYVILKRKVGLECWMQITQAMENLNLNLPETRVPNSLLRAAKALRRKAIFGVDDYLRQYPSRSLASHILGYVESGETETEHGNAFEDHGVTGVELTLDAMLTGVHGWRTTGEEMAPSHGLDAVLTIDANVQHIVEDELLRVYQKYSPVSVSAIVVRPRTGEILALANLPTFDPNLPSQNPTGQLNHALVDTYEPGSTFKIVTITTALNDGLLTLNEQVFCENGRWFYGGKPLHDHHPYAMLSFENVVARSSNIGTAKAALRLGPARLYQTITNFGFNRVTGIPLPAENGGRVHPTNAWSKLSITRVPIGHEVAATPMQMVMAMAAIANGGVLMQPKLIERLQDQTGRVVRTFPARSLRRVASEAACREMTRALRSVASEEGTGTSAQLEYYTVAGKTGTAEKFANGTYKSGKYYASFIGFLPATDPELCILVGVDEPDRRVGHMGGAVAAPAFRGIAERTANYLRLPPDLSPEPEAEPAPKSKGEPQPALANRRALADATHRLPGAVAPRR